ncbi:ComEC/Rec2 family competence protein [Candidatus Saccharibacteria bacterium]|nr:ComEC/Rec2 family competence protein [Candidatus Saccharibacteria bacterium]
MLIKMWSNIHQSYFVVALCVGVIIGTVLALVFHINYFTSPFYLILVALLLLFIYFCPRFAFLGIALVAGMILIFVRVALELHGEAYIRQFWGQIVTITGTVDGDPNSDEKGTSLKVTNLKFGNEKIETRGSIYVSLRFNKEIQRADEITLSGKLTEGFGIYAGYMYKPKVGVIQRPRPGDLILGIRNWFAERIRKMIEEPKVSLGLSYLLGMKSGLSDDLNENLRIVGLTHIVVASGAHLSILVEIARKIFGRLSRFAGLMFSTLFIVFFMAMIGWTPSILRAGLMAILSLIVWYFGRKIAPWRLISIVMAFTLIINPMFVINLGWLLSFTSYTGIMILGPKLTKFFYGEKSPKFLASTVLVTVSATLMTLPITLYYFGTVSLISVVANLLILPTLPLAMGLTFLTGVVMGIPGVELVSGYATTKVLEFHITVVNFFATLKQFLVEIEPYQWWVFGMYLIFLIPVVFGYLKKSLWYNRRHE